MHINNNYQLSSPNFKQITITSNGKKAMNSWPYVNKYFQNAMKHATALDTKYWDLNIDGISCGFNKYYNKELYDIVFEYKSKKTGEVFKNLSVCTNTSSESVGKSKNCNHLPCGTLLFSNEGYVNDKKDLKELIFSTDKEGSYNADRILWHLTHSHSFGEREIRTYMMLEEMSGKYKSSLNTDVDSFIKANPKYMEELNKFDNKYGSFVWKSNSDV